MEDAADLVSWEHELLYLTRDLKQKAPSGFLFSVS